MGRVDGMLLWKVHRFFAVADQGLTTEDKEQWRDYLLGKIVEFLQDNKDEILDQYLALEECNLSSKEIQSNGLMDFDISITLHCDRRSGYGLGDGFFKANLIR